MHGGRAVIEALFAALRSFAGVRGADPGEFTRRAFGNGKFDLMEAEGLADLIEATTESQRRQALHHFEGGASRRARTFGEPKSSPSWRGSRQPSTSSTSPASPMPRWPRRYPASRALTRRSPLELERGKRGQRLRSGLRVVLAGPPNAGKSSLLNRLARKDAAIVSPIAGTTRDVVEVHLNLEGLPVILQDTAGLRAEAGDPIERMGMARTAGHHRGADLVLWIGGGGRGWVTCAE